MTFFSSGSGGSVYVKLEEHKQGTKINFRKENPRSYDFKVLPYHMAIGPSHICIQSTFL